VAKGILARKVGMTQIFTERGTVVPVTVLESDSCHVVQRKTTSNDGYEALQIGFGEQLAKRVNKPLSGHYRRAGVRPLRRLTELRDPGEAEIGSRLRVEMFSEGELVDVTGISQGKGFAGTVKRHGFSRGPVSHGSMNTRQPGSIGSVDAARTFKGVKMSGHYGSVRRTVRHLEVVRVDSERNLLLVKGAVPGHKNAVVLVRPSDREERLS
jgi:large subunit ribosomal protein L3